MATDPQLVQITFAAGINEAVRTEAVDPQSGFLVRQNVRQPQRGVADKRPGFAARSRTRLDATTRTAGRNMFARAHEVCVIDGHTIDSWSSAYGANVNVDRVPDLGVERFPVIGTDSSSSDLFVDRNIGFAYANGLYFVLSLTTVVSGLEWDLNLTVFDATTKAIVARFPRALATDFVTNAPESRLCAVGSTVVLAWVDPADTYKIKGVSLDASTSASLLAGFGITHTLTTTYKNGAGWDVAGMETSFVLAWSRLGGAGGVAAATFNPSTLAQIATGVVTADATAQYVAVDGSEADFIWVAYGKTGTSSGYVTGLNAACAVTSTETAILVNAFGVAANGRSRFGIRRTSSTGGYVVARGDITDTSGHGFSFTGWQHMGSREFSTAAGATTAVGTQNVLHGWTPHSQPFALDGRVYAFAALTAESAMPRNLVAFDITAYTGFVRPCASPAAGNCLYYDSGVVACLHIAQVSATKVAFLMMMQGNAVDSALQIVELDCTSTHRWQTAEHNGVMYLSGGQIYGYDGAQTFESGFVAPPAIRVVDAGAGSIGAGTYSYTAIVEWGDAEGNVHWSEPAPPQTITIAASHNVYIDVLGYASTWRDSIVTSASAFAIAGRIKVFRTKNGGGAYYLVTTMPLVRDIVMYSPTDSSTDAVIGSHAQLYTVLGEPGAALVRRAPSSSVALVNYHGQLVSIGEDRRTLYATGQQVIGEGAWWNPIFQYPMGAELTALAVQDGALFVFDRRAIYAIAGEPPSDNGTTGGFGTPRRLACDVGCADPRSICVTSKGIFFRALDGTIYVLSRALSAEWVGEAVQVTASAYPICTGITLTPDAARVYVDLAQSETNGVVGGNGVTLVYDLARGLWDSTDVRTSAAATASCPAQSACVVDSGTAWVYAWLSSDGYVHLEDSSTYLDPGNTWVQKKVASADFKVSGLQGYQHINKCMLLAKNLTGHDLNLELAYDYAPTYKTAASWTRAQIDALTSGIPNEQLYHDPHDDARCEAFRVQLSDAAPSSGALGTGQGAPWVGLTIEVAPQPRTYPLPAGSG